MRPMKDGLDGAAIERIAKAFAGAGPGFDTKGFRRQALAGLEELELKQRVDHIRDALAASLPGSWKQALPLVLAAGENFPAGEPGDPLRGFAAWPVIQWVPLAGAAHPEEALEALRCLTRLFTAEFAIRPFLAAHPELALGRLACWVEDPDPAVRRLVSEGSRPRLPWGERLRALQQDPGPMLPLLERLRDDPDGNVRRSVANHLNDLSKDHPERLVRLCADWLTDATGERRALVKHALRSLVKAGDPQALALLGAGQATDLHLCDFRILTPQVRLGQALEFTFGLEIPAGAPRTIVLDYALVFPGSRGQARRKVFKLSTLQLEGGSCRTWQRKHPIRPITTRTYYEGDCQVELLANGHCLGQAGFRLVVEDSGSESGRPS